MNEKKEFINFKPRELKVIQLVAEGFSNREIAEILKFSYNTIKQDIRNIVYKSNSRNRINAVYNMLSMGYLKTEYLDLENENKKSWKFQLFKCVSKCLLISFLVYEIPNCLFNSLNSSESNNLSALFVVDNVSIPLWNEVVIFATLAYWAAVGSGAFIPAIWYISDNSAASAFGNAEVCLTKPRAFAKYLGSRSSSPTSFVSPCFPTGTSFWLL